MSPRVRHWMKAPTDRPARRAEPSGPWTIRRVSLDDAPVLGALMDDSYRGTIDHEGETLDQCVEEMRATISGKYGPYLDQASFVAVDSEGAAAGASLLTLWKGKPLLAYCMTRPSAQG